MEKNTSSQEVSTKLGECDCGSMRCKYTREYYATRYECPDCGSEGIAYDEDVYGCMSVPWGYL